MAYTFRKRMDDKKKKGVIVDHAMDINRDECEILLNFQVQKGEGIDEPRPLQSMRTRYYRVYAWIHPEDQAWSKLMRGVPNPVWNTQFRLPLDDFEPAGKYLHLEVVKFEEEFKDPETSSGEVLVGRARVRLPDDLTKVKSGTYQLVKLHEDKTTKPAGYITVSNMQFLKRAYRRSLY